MNIAYDDITEEGTKIDNNDFTNFFSTGISILTNPKIKPVE